MLLEWARKNGVRRIVSTTSYADVQNRWSASEPVREDWPRNFRLDGDHAAYVISKNASADLLFYYNEQYGMRNCVFRLPQYTAVVLTARSGSTALSRSRALVFSSTRRRWARA